MYHVVHYCCSYSKEELNGENLDTIPESSVIPQGNKIVWLLFFPNFVGTLYLQISSIIYTAQEINDPVYTHQSGLN